MDATIINPFIAATASVFKEMFGLDAAPDKPYVLEETTDSKWEISGLIGLAETLLGRTGMTFKTEDEKKQMVGGLVAELANIVSGNAAGRFKDINLDIAPPVVVRGDKHQISWPKIAPVLAVPMKTPAGAFELDVYFKGA